MAGEIKRRRVKSSPAASTSESEPAVFNNFPPNNLGDELLIEILLRLPTAGSAVRCKLVSKRWCSLISTSYFISQFTSHHINKNDSNPPIFFVTNNYVAYYHYNDNSLVNLITDRKVYEKEYRLDFYPNLKQQRATIVASCNDLLVCWTWPANYYICNPLTMQCLLLPAVHIRNRSVDGPGFHGLVCEPADSQRWGYEPRFRVLSFVPLTSDDSAMDVYCSETGQWTESLLSGSKFDCCSNVAANHGKLHWYNGVDDVAYNPFNNGDTIFIDGSGLKLPSNLSIRSSRLGVAQGSLRFMQMAISNSIDPANDHFKCLGAQRL